MDLRSAACLADLFASTYKPNIIKNALEDDLKLDE